MKVLDVDPRSPVFGRVRPGYRVISVNGKRVLDSIDFRFRTSGERCRIRFADLHGYETEIKVDDVHGDLGLTLDDSRTRTCDNNCIFCFVHQQPKGMRRALYVKDEDYRLSFTHGNFVTLTNTSQADLKRIVAQRLSPLYVSVHTTDEALRRSMLGNRRVPPILPRLKYLTGNGITIHTQVVLCPGVNDGAQLENTIDQLSSLRPGVATLAVVPVGLTRYRDRLPKLRAYTPGEAAAIIDSIEKRQRDFHARLGSRLVWPADEFYVLAGRDFPKRCDYEEMSQFENGVGMAREVVTMFNRRRRYLAGIKSRRRVMFLTGYSAYPFLSRNIVSHVRNGLGLKLSLEPVPNRFWGETVTVSGLLTARDLLRHAMSRVTTCDMVVLPPNCLNADSLFLDDLSLADFRAALGKPVLVGRYDLADTIREAFS
jgi:putative radical SAM enzyme (TIGR03279 family)